MAYASSIQQFRSGRIGAMRYTDMSQIALAAQTVRQAPVSTGWTSRRQNEVRWIARITSRLDATGTPAVPLTRYGGHEAKRVGNDWLQKPEASGGRIMSIAEVDAGVKAKRWAESRSGGFVPVGAIVSVVERYLEDGTMTREIEGFANPQMFTAIVASSQSIADKRWRYAFTEVRRIAPPSTQWDIVAGGATSSRLGDPWAMAALNTLEASNAGATEVGVGVLLSSPSATISLKPIRTGAIVHVVRFETPSGPLHEFAQQNAISVECSQ